MNLTGLIDRQPRNVELPERVPTFRSLADFADLDLRARWLTYLTQIRMCSQRTFNDPLTAVPTHSPTVYVGGSETLTLAHKQAPRFPREGADLSDHHRIQLICTPTVFLTCTVLNNHNFRAYDLLSAVIVSAITDDDHCREMILIPQAEQLRRPQRAHAES